MLIAFLLVWLISIIITINIIDTSSWKDSIGEMIFMIIFCGPLMTVLLFMFQDNEQSRERKRIRSLNATEETRYLLEDFDDFLNTKPVRKTPIRRTRRAQ